MPLSLAAFLSFTLLYCHFHDAFAIDAGFASRHISFSCRFRFLIIYFRYFRDAFRLSDIDDMMFSFLRQIDTFDDAMICFHLR